MRLAWFLVLVFPSVFALASELPSFNFTQEAQLDQWSTRHDLRNASVTAEGVRFQLTGEDPYLIGPPRDYPAGVALRISIRLRSEQGGVAQVFFFRDHATEANSVRIAVRAGAWAEAQANLPALGPGYRLRIDPPGTGGACVIRGVRFIALRGFTEPQWPPPVDITDAKPGLTLTSGGLKLVHGGKMPGGFAIEIGGRRAAVGWNNGLIGYLDGENPVWVPIHDTGDSRVENKNASIVETVSLRDPGGATWRLSRRFSSGQAGTIDVVTTTSVSVDRQVLFLPLFGLFPGVGSFGTHKTQAVFPGLEYLDKDEPSSSEADAVGPASRRQVPDSLKITFPLMTVAADGRYVGLTWEQQPQVAAVFDSPDRLFRSGGHAMGLIFPGSDSVNRVEGSLLPLSPVPLRANESLTLKATIIGGEANDITAAVHHYVALRGLPAVPRPMDFEGYLRLASTGWLDSRVHDGAQYHHAIPGGFAAQPAADAAMMQDWLASQAADAALTTRLQTAAQTAIAKIPPEAYNFAAISHIRYPIESLVYGHVAENAEQADQHGRALLGRFEANGSVHYRSPSSGDDLGKTHFAPDANGLTASLVMQVLQDATASGDAELIRQSLRLLHGLDKFAGTAPRGAQTWEVPLHTPDVLASAHLVHAYVLGYELSGEAHLLEQAKYWAWTGVPFIYLTSPSEPVGPYAGIAVLGATHWKGPVWMGLPVQWCALVYADALYRLAPLDPDGPWKQLADGITASGIQQTWPIGLDAARQGLLPDSFNLRAQSRNDAAINPGTLQADAARLYDRVPMSDFHGFRGAGLLVHVPGRILKPRESPQGISFDVQSWVHGPYYVLIAGLKHQPRVRVGDHNVSLTEPHEYVSNRGRLILRLEGEASVHIEQ